MKYLNSMFAVLALLFASTFTAPSANAQGLGAFFAHNYYVSHNVSATWFPVVTSLTRGIQGITILDGSGEWMELGVAPANAASNTETAVLIVPASVGTQHYDLAIPYGFRVSLKAFNTAATTGVNDINFFYN